MFSVSGRPFSLVVHRQSSVCAEEGSSCSVCTPAQGNLQGFSVDAAGGKTDSNGRCSVEKRGVCHRAEQLQLLDVTGRQLVGEISREERLKEPGVRAKNWMMEWLLQTRWEAKGKGTFFTLQRSNIQNNQEGMAQAMRSASAKCVLDRSVERIEVRGE